MYKRYVYVSKAVEGFAIADITDMMRLAQLRNQQDDLTGALLYHEGFFVQALEGQSEKVDHCIEQILADKRHCQIDNREAVNTNIRMFPSLWMPMTLGSDVDTSLLNAFSYQKGFPRQVFPTGKLERLLVTISLNQWPPPLHQQFKSPSQQAA